MPDPTDRETYEADTALCEVCGEPFTLTGIDRNQCEGCAGWADIAEYFY